MNCKALTVPVRKSESRKYGRQWEQSNVLLWWHG